MPKPVYQIAAMSDNRAIGLNRKLPWSIPEEWNYFMEQTRDGVMIMGRICAEEFGQALPDRDMIAITTQKDLQIPGFQMAGTLEEAFALAQHSSRPGPIWICGGVDIYLKTLPLSDKLYLSHVPGEFEADTFMPEQVLTEFPEKIGCQEFKDSSSPFKACIYNKKF